MFIATQKLKLSVRKLRKDLKNNLDRTIRQYVGTPFYAAYFASRKTYNLNSSSTTLRGTILDASGLHLPKAEVTIVHPEINRSVLTTKKGTFRFRNLDLDTCTLRITCPKYLPAEFDITLKRNHTSDFKIQMVPAPLTETPVVNAPGATIVST